MLIIERCYANSGLNTKINSKPDVYYTNGLTNMALQLYKSPNGTYYLEVILYYDGTKKTIALSNWT